MYDQNRFQYLVRVQKRAAKLAATDAFRAFYDQADGEDLRVEAFKRFPQDADARVLWVQAIGAFYRAETLAPVED